MVPVTRVGTGTPSTRTGGPWPHARTNGVPGAADRRRRASRAAPKRGVTVPVKMERGRPGNGEEPGEMGLDGARGP